jgi:hypothetical protein
MNEFFWRVLTSRLHKQAGNRLRLLRTPRCSLATNISRELRCLTCRNFRLRTRMFRSRKICAVRFESACSRQERCRNFLHDRSPQRLCVDAARCAPHLDSWAAPIAALSADRAAAIVMSVNPAFPIPTPPIPAWVLHDAFIVAAPRW